MAFTDIKLGVMKVTSMQLKNSRFALLYPMLVMLAQNTALAESKFTPTPINTATRYTSISMRQPNIPNAKVQEERSVFVQIAPPLTTTPDHNLSRALGNNGIRIVTATVDLYEDNDDDGYYQSFVLRFDPESSYRRTQVYATIHIRENGSEWNSFYTTDRFIVETNSPWDMTEISARVLGGYPTSEYDLLITLYDAECCGPGIPLLSFYHPVLAGLTLEDADYDDSTYSNTTPVYAVTTVAGAAHPLLLISLLMVLATRRKQVSGDDPLAHGHAHERARRPSRLARRSL